VFYEGVLQTESYCGELCMLPKGLLAAHHWA